MLFPGHHPGDGQGVEGIGLARTARPPPLPPGKDGWHLPDVLARLQQGPRQHRPEVRRSLEPDPSGVREPVQPPTQRPVAVDIIAEAPLGDRPADLVHGARRQALLVRVHSHREHFPLPFCLAYDAAGGRTHMRRAEHAPIKSRPPAPSGAGGRSIRKSRPARADAV